MPTTRTSIAFIAPSVVEASRVKPVPGVAFKLRAKASPSMISGVPSSEVLDKTLPAVTVKNGPLTANSASGSTPTAIMTVDLSPLLMRPL